MENLDFYKYELNAKTVKKAASRLAFQPVQFKMIGTAIAISATGINRNIISTIMAHLGAYTSEATDGDIVALAGKYNLNVFKG